MNKEKIKQQFISEARKIWGDSVKNLNINVRVGHNINPKKDYAYASLESSRRIKHYAIGNNLITTSKNLTLQLNPKALDLPQDKFKGVLRHEALHIGYHRHDKNFRSIAERLNIPVSFGHEGFVKVQEQRGKGKRYQTVTTAKDEKEGHKIALDMLRKNRSKGYKYRLEW